MRAVEKAERGGEKATEANRSRRVHEGPSCRRASANAAGTRILGSTAGKIPKRFVFHAALGRRNEKSATPENANGRHAPVARVVVRW